MEDWKLFDEQKPEYQRRVAYFRYQKEKFGIGKLSLLHDEDGNESESWVTEYGSCNHPDPNDRWIYLPPLTFVKNVT
jgi:hypothetical protein